MCLCVQTRDPDNADWWEYHVDHLPTGWRSLIPNGGYPSQRKTVKLPCAAPRADIDVVRRLRNLLVTSSPQLLGLLRSQINSLCKDMRVLVSAAHFGTNVHDDYGGVIVDFAAGFFLIRCWGL